MAELNLIGTGSVVNAAGQGHGSDSVNWQYDDTDIVLLGPEKHKHHGEHQVATYKGHKLRILRLVVGDGTPHYEWQGEVDGAAIADMVASHSNTIADALVAHVDALS
jgi:hypothetical protein